jgi:DNA-binding transcriptional LysR family regulator
MRFDLVDLQLFIAVATERSITAGAHRAHLALASASARIKGLEAALGTALLKRGRRGVELTAAGESLLDHARIIIHNVEAMRGDLAAYASGVRASVHLLANTSGLSEHLPKAAARIGVRLRFRARLRDFDAICQMVAAGVGVAVVPEAAAKRCARSMPITMIKIRDAWANRKLAICARSFKTLPRPAKQLVEHLRKVAQH